MSYAGAPDPASDAGVAQAAVEQALAALTRALAAATAADGSATAAAASQAAAAKLLAALGLDHRWTGTALQLRLPDGSYGPAVDLKGEDGPAGPAVTLAAGQATVAAAGAAWSASLSPDPANPTRYILDFVAPAPVPGAKGDRGDEGPPGPSGVSFVGASATSLPIAVGPVSVVLSAATRAAYAPTLYQALVSAADPTVAMVGVLSGYDAASGTLSLSIVQAAGSGPRSDWIVTSTPPLFVPSGIDGGYVGDPNPPPGANPVYGTSSTAGAGVDGGYA